MHPSLRRTVLLGVLATAAAGAWAQTKMFKCTVAGRTIYQQTACGNEADVKPAVQPVAARGASDVPVPARPASAASGAGRATPAK
jgi:hypothetical protein